MAHLPEDFINKYTQLLGEEADSFFNSFSKPVQKAYRINPLKAKTSALDVPDQGHVPYGQWGHFGQVSGHTVAHVTGAVYSQEPSAQFVGEVVHPQPGERVLDLSAAPGGKTTHLASFMQQKGLLWSNEIFMNRAKILSENVERFGIQNAIVTSHTPAELSARLPQYFDKILLDAPCSGEGMFRKNETAIQQWHKDFPQELADLQRRILHEAVKMLRPGGQIIYSTCTFAPEEDEQMIAWLMSTYPTLTLNTIEKPPHIHLSDGRPEWADKHYTDGLSTESLTKEKTDLKKTARLWPHLLNGEGHFVAKLSQSKEIQKIETEVEPLKQKAMDRQQQQLIASFLTDTLVDFDLNQRILTLFGERLYLAPKETPDISGMKILRLGLEMGIFKKKRFEPAHALALALHPDAVVQHFDMTQAQWMDFVHGDVIRTQATLKKGWVLMTANGNGVGWGRYVDGQIKNFLPKGLRFALKQTDSLS
ncbi:RsmF rRNA methyltransferase first C-terminal domain-containing protein [Leuconostoc rapi]|uniref:RsmF rRNA methyltransferase first C-terminal domain-containing protein n=1 Tax=Leuconostoc rapi TaxID=1406906 RepID=UPI00195D305B|nr:RsmF rRNA methyltransferase first C-terminal domain-containing protein [Leuconostoc rapi]MBM7434927.1 16S rRNA C967 or C1407 C5-methylase (RsmB/RsmF family)/NOL1/NOP2/fmu family ribosome biogenesis protein [Leuconostoc rapi]